MPVRALRQRALQAKKLLERNALKTMNAREGIKTECP